MPRHLRASIALWAVTAAGLSPLRVAADSQTLYSSDYPLLEAGARALERGDAEEGIRLTRAALRDSLPLRDGAAAHSNLCAGFVLLERFVTATAHCDRAEALDPTNWRIYNNRAVAYLGRDLLDEAIRDFRRALSLRPGADMLQRSLAVAEARRQSRSDTAPAREPEI